MSALVPMTGIVLSSQPIGEYDRRLVILTKERGKIAVFARGVRRPTSCLLGATRNFAFGTFLVYEGRTSYNLQSADIKNYFEDVFTDYDITMYACYFAELADYYGREGIGAKDDINLLYAALSALTDERLDMRIIRSVYEIRLVSGAGECPPLEEIFSDPERLPVGAIKAYNYSLTAPLERVFKFTLSEETIPGLSQIGYRIIDHAVDKKLKTKEMLP